MTKSAVLLRFIEDYADGILNMPTAVMVYDRDGKLFAGLRFPDEATQ